MIASQGLVTDVTEVPSDTVRAQLEHLEALAPLSAIVIGVLGNHRIVEVVFRSVERCEGPVVLDLRVAGSHGETLLTSRGLDALMEQLQAQAVDLVLLHRRDAELITGGEIRSLDDAQVAAQRAHGRGMQRVLIKCGVLAPRFFEGERDLEQGAPDGGYMTDLYFDGDEFALFEAPRIAAEVDTGAGSALALAFAHARLEGAMPEDALQFAKKFVTDRIREAHDGHRRAA